MEELWTVLDDDLEALVLEGVAVRHVEVLEVKLSGMHGLGLHVALLGQVDAGDLVATWGEETGHRRLFLNH